MFPKRLLALILFATLAVMPPCVLRAQWVQTNGPGIPTVTSFAVIGTTIFAGTSGSGVFRSTNMGLNWTSLSNGVSNASNLTVLGTDLFAIVQDGNTDVWRSTDYGNSWSRATSLTGSNSYYVSVLTTYDDTLFAGTAGNGLFFSTDFGASWTNIPATISISVLSVHGNYILEGDYNTLLNMYLSPDFGKSWNSTNVGQPLSLFTFIDSEIWVGSTNGAVVRSTDYGVHWHVTNKLNGSIISVTAMGNSIFAATSSQIMRTPDRGTSWDSCGQLTSVTALGEAGTNLFVATNNGVLRSSDNGASWQNANTGIVGSSCINIAVSDSNIVAAAAQDLYSTTDNGYSWSAEVFNSGSSIFFITVADSIAFVYDQVDLYRLNLNNGSGWEDISDYLPEFTIYYHGQQTEYPVSVAGLATVGSIIFAQTNEMGVIRSTDYGITWSLVNLNTSLGGFGIDDTIIYASASGAIYRSSDFGANWTLISNKVPSASTVHAVGAMQGSIFVSTSQGVFRSKDSGMTWNAESSGLKDSNVTFLSQNGKIFAEGSNAIYYWLESSSEWLPVDEGLPASFTWGQIAANDNYLFVGTSGLGVWERPLSDFGSNLNSSSVINSLYVYPNPISTTTNISFTALEQGNATVKIFDQIGRVESSVFEGELEPGEYSFDWIKPTGLPNGAYMCEVSMNGQSAHSLLIILQ
jgi:photosystem II stability/assembly factor-like uncharacterized protein